MGLQICNGKHTYCSKGSSFSDDLQPQKPCGLLGTGDGKLKGKGCGGMRSQALVPVHTALRTT